MKRAHSPTPPGSPEKITKLSPAEPPIVAPVLDVTQQRAIDAVLSGKSIFLTGSAGTGKTFTLQHILRLLREDPRVHVHVASSTARSALLVDPEATTIQRFLGMWNTGSSEAHVYVRNLHHERNRNKLKGLVELTHLVIDEISMINADFLDKVNEILQRSRNSAKPFGGIQVIVSGDFMQLRPVGCGSPGIDYAFHAKSWKFELCELSSQHRQATDPDYARLLQCARFGTLLQPQVALLEARRLAQPTADQRFIVHLYSRNDKADRHNDEMMTLLPADTRHVYRRTVTVDFRGAVQSKKAAEKAEDKIKRDLDSATRTPATLELRIGAKVMMTSNLSPDLGLVNGACGIVLGYDCENYPVVEFPSGIHVIRQYPIEQKTPEWKATYRQLPLILAWAITVHKSQGATISTLVADLSRDSMFEPGMAYVILSRTNCSANIFLPNFDRAAVYADPIVTAFYEGAVPAP